MLGLEADLASLWSRLGASGEAPYADLVRRYSERHRAYHTLEHIAQCLGDADEARAPDVVRLALWYHDAVYVPRKTDNEERSADLVLALPIDAVVKRRAADLVLATKHTAVPADEETRLLMDIDLSILGRPAEEFDLYEKRIRKEYRWVPGPMFRSKRAQILKSFLDRPTIYGTDRFRAKYEAAARANLARSIAALS